MNCIHVYSQQFTRQTYHDKEKKHLKEVYQVKDTIRNTHHGRYISYFLNGHIESKGQFTNDETTGIWEFYYETGNIRMRGILFKGMNYGLWEYFYESGQKSMEGIIYGKNREGEWKTFYENGNVKEIGEYKENKRTGIWKSYFEDGVLKGQIEYADDFGRYTEYDHTGKVVAEGPKTGSKNTGHWRFFAADGTLREEGAYTNGKRGGEWTTYFPSGKVESKGNYENDHASGPWKHYYESGQVNSEGNYLNGQKNGVWNDYYEDGKKRSEGDFSAGSGVYKEFHPSGKIKAKGAMLDGKRHGEWEFYAEDGRVEGKCTFEKGMGTYYGYYPNGNLQTKGTLDGDLKVGTWEIYLEDGTLSGYYRPFYDNRKLSEDIVTLTQKSSPPKPVAKSRKFTYFDERNNEFHGVIVSTNPVWMAIGKIPLGIEFYIEERLGHEFEFTGIRRPFFQADADVAPGKQFERGYSVSIKQKLYNPLEAGMWYFGHEIRFTNLGHFVNQPLNIAPDNIFTFNAVEQRFEYGLLLGYRIMRRNDAPGFTIDAFVTGNIGYRTFDVDPNFSTFFEDVEKSKLAYSFHFGLNLGHVFSYR